MASNIAYVLLFLKGDVMGAVSDLKTTFPAVGKPHSSRDPE